jgi:hypothetical protein
VHFTFETYLAIAGVFLGLAAIAMAAPPLFQMLYGRPRLEFAADEFTDADGGKSLLITIKNKKIESQFLRKIGVERETGSVVAFLDIQEQGTNKFIAKDVSGLLHCAPMGETGLLARALPLFTVGIPVIRTKGVISGIVDARSDQLKPINEGDYTVYADVVCCEQIHKITKNFKVGKAPHLTIWV